MAESPTCPQCGAALTPNCAEGLCPQCLLLVGLPSQAPADVAATAASPARGFAPPTPEALAARFPQLEILELLGQGGMGAVYKARQRGLDRLVAVKILPSEISADPAFAERFMREARALARLGHPHIVAVHDVGQTADGLCYFIMEYVEGVNLREALRSGGVTPQQALAIVPQVCEALQFAHDEGIVHRDIKPENILIDKRGRVKIADFGLAKLLGANHVEGTLTGTHQVMGTVRYMAPEQLEGAREVDHRADIYSLGVVFYELLTGELPLGRFAPPSRKVQIDVRLDEVVLRALEKEPGLRYQHASELKTGVEHVAQTPSSTTPPPGPRPSEVPPATPAGVARISAVEMIRTAVLLALPLVCLVATFVPSYTTGWVADYATAPTVELPLAGGRGTGTLALPLQARYVPAIQYWQGKLIAVISVAAVCAVLVLAAARRREWILAGVVALAGVAIAAVSGHFSQHFENALRMSGTISWAHMHELAARGKVASPPAFVENFFRDANWVEAITAMEADFNNLSTRYDMGSDAAQKAAIDGVVYLRQDPLPGQDWMLFLGIAAVLLGAVDGLLGRPREPAATPATPRGPRLARAAVWGAVWAPMAILVPMAVFWFTGLSSPTHGEPPAGPPAWAQLLMVVLGLASAIAPLGTTILGTVAISQIRRSEGRLYGLPIAVADALFFPLLLLDGLILLAVATFGQAVVTAFRDDPRIARLAEPVSLIIVLVLAIPVDWLIVRAVWRRVTDRPPRGTNRSGGSLLLVGLLGALLTIGLCAAAALYWSQSRSRGETSRVATPPSFPGQFSVRRSGRVEYLHGHNTVAVDAAVSGDGAWLASADEQGHIIVRRLDRLMGRDEPRLVGPLRSSSSTAKPIHKLLATDDGERFVVAGNLGTPSVRIMSFAGRGEAQVSVPTQGTIGKMFLCDHDQTLAYLGLGGGVTFYDLTHGVQLRQVSVYPHQVFDFVRALVVAPDGKHFAVTSANAVNNGSTDPYKLTLLDIEGGEQLSWEFDNAVDWSQSQVFFTAADTLSMCLPKGAMRRWRRDADANTWREIEPLPSPAGWFNTGAVALDGRTIYLATSTITQALAPDGSKYDLPVAPYHVLAVDTDTGKLLWREPIAIEARKSSTNYAADPINALVPVPRSKRVVAPLWDGQIAVIDPTP